MPFDRDEGAWAYAGWLLLDGYPPFTYFYDAKMAGTYYIYAFFMMLFGQTIEGVRIGILFTILINIFLIYIVSKKISGNSDTGILACSFYALFSLDYGALALSGYTTHFVLTFIMLSVIFLLDALKKENVFLFFLSGLFAGCSFCVKQPAVFFIILFMFYILIVMYLRKTAVKKIIKNVLSFIAGAAAVFLVICLIMKIYGVFDKFWFMTITFATSHGQQLSLNNLYHTFSFFIREYGIFLKVIFVLTILYCFFVILYIKETEKKLLYATLFISAVLFLLSGFYLRPHYFIIFSLPAALFLSEKFYDSKNKQVITEKLNNWLCVLLLVLLIFTQNDVLFKLSPEQVSRKIFRNNPFPESIEIAKFIKNNTKDSDKIVIIGSEPQILFYAKRKSATGYVCFNQLMDVSKIADEMQIEAIKEIEQSKPAYLIFVNIYDSLGMYSGSSTRIFDWLKNTTKNLELSGIVNIISSDRTDYVWGPQAEKYRLSSNSWIAVFKFK
jgi:hypothetical protein